MEIRAGDIEKYIQTGKDFIDACLKEDVSFEHAKILLVNRLHITMGEATSRIELYEKFSHKQLSR